MRGELPGLVNPHPLVDVLPVMLQEDPLAALFAELGDAMLAPVVATLDNLDAYLDPAVAPVDHVLWLGTWVGATFERSRRRARGHPDGDAGREADLRRDLRSAVPRHATAGRAGDFARHLEELTGLRVIVQENGACDWSSDPRQPLPGSARLEVLVRVHGGTDADVSRVEAALRQVKPAHVPHRVELAQHRVELA